MKREPFIAHSELTNEIYIIVGKEKYRVTEQAIKAVKAIEALEQEPKTGHWEIIPCGNNHGEYRPPKYMCSECGWEIDLCRGLQQNTGHRLFCEHCGAKMESEDKE